MKMSRKAWAGTIGMTLFALWLGVPTLSRWRADKLVDELCAKDGGVKVYETVVLPKEKFNQWRQFHVIEQRAMKPGDEYYTAWKTEDIIGRHNSSEIWRLSVYRHHFLMYRTADKKILGESIGYTRRGGDPIGPWMPSAYECPDDIDNELSKQVFFSSK